MENAARFGVWEHNYYSSKEGSERAISPSINGAPSTGSDVDESDITDQQVVDYVVAPDRPRYLTIPKLNIKNARILEVGTTHNGQLSTPVGIFDAGWYQNSSRPGYGGTLLLDGHNGGPTKHGIFKELPSLQKGDIITIERGDGTKFNYTVVENETVPLSEANGKMPNMEQSPIPGQESLSIITCTGDWSQRQQTYLSRQFLRAVLTKQK